MDPGDKVLKICRLCLKSDKFLLPLFSKLRMDYVPEMIKQTTNIQVRKSDNLPQKICETCITKLDFACNIRKEFILNERRIKSIIGTSSLAKYCQKSERLKHDATETYSEQLLRESKDVLSGEKRVEKDTSTELITPEVKPESPNTESIPSVPSLVFFKGKSIEAPKESVQKTLLHGRRQSICLPKQASSLSLAENAPKRQSSVCLVSPFTQPAAAKLKETQVSSPMVPASVKPQTATELRLAQESREILEAIETLQQISKGQDLPNLDLNQFDPPFEETNGQSPVIGENIVVPFTGFDDSSTDVISANFPNFFESYNAKNNFENEVEIAISEQDNLFKENPIIDDIDLYSAMQNILPTSDPTSILKTAITADDSDEITQYFGNEGVDDDAFKINFCHICRSDFNSALYLEEHLLSHNEMIPYKCSDCKSQKNTIKTLTALNKHFKMHSNPIPCEFCSKKFANILDKFQHEKRMHTDKQVVSCNECGKSFQSKYYLKIHLNTHSGVHKFVCSVCKKSFSSKFVLTRHEKNHSDTAKTFFCPYCGKAFRYASNFEVHKQHHIVSGGFKCLICSEIQKTKEQLLSHYNACSTKGADLRETYKLTTTIVNGVTETLCACLLCSYTCSTKALMHNHSRNHVKKHQCKTCSKQFGSETKLKDHVNTHTGAKPYSCKICRKSFASSSTLYVHMDRHAEEKRYECKFCKKKFASFQAMKKHVKIHNNKCPKCHMRFQSHELLQFHQLQDLCKEIMPKSMRQKKD